MSEMVERVADHISRKVGPSIDPKVCEMAARVAIEAMREPTEAMKNAGSEGGEPPGHCGSIWERMIDEALK